MSNSMDINDDMNTDWLDNLSDQYAELFFWIEKQFEEDEIPEEPSPAELNLMDENAEQLLRDLKEDENDKNNRDL